METAPFSWVVPISVLSVQELARLWQLPVPLGLPSIFGTRQGPKNPATLGDCALMVLKTREVTMVAVATEANESLVLEEGLVAWGK
jgi:hypothetical protein